MNHNQPGNGFNSIFDFDSSAVENLRGGSGDDRVVGAGGGDDMKGGADNDTLVWNNGDGSDVIDGDGGTGSTAIRLRLPR